MLRIVFLAVILLLGVTRANAQISAENLPSLGNLGKLIGQADQAEVEQTIANQGGLISANIPAKDTARGRTATELANLLSEGDPARQKALEASFEQARVGYEKYLTDANFDKTDLGVALSANFIILWELASDTLLPPDSALKLGKYLVNIFGKASDAANAAEEDKSRLC